MNESASHSTLLARSLTLAVILGAGYLLFVTFRPFFPALAWAGLLAFALDPGFLVILRLLRGRENLAAMFTRSLYCSSPVFSSGAAVGWAVDRRLDGRLPPRTILVDIPR